MPVTTVKRPRLTTTPDSQARNTWIAYNHDEVLGRIYRDHSHNFYYCLSRGQISERFGTLTDAISDLFKTRQQAKKQHQAQSKSQFDSISKNWGHVSVPGGNTRQVSNTATRKPTFSHMETVIINGSECVKTRHGLIPIE